MISCRNCGQVREPYENTEWCVPCVNMEMALQGIEDTHLVMPEVIDPNRVVPA